ncbi:TRAP transporter small permease [Ruegeria litorea]|uniref:TRAP transporter small permease protein n=1 Tax=Falsiruegeria litorea TaxID=1280831 RepID=A0ABS5WW04_9RHOB|nr:TRAP transporter small permease [Falsiruegeria litorea]MBT3143228.1 TRAP transporter small permease [Falsiruegeria litorea]
MRLVLRLIDAVSYLALICAGFILVYAVGHILLETVLRSLFDTSTHVLDEFIGFAILSVTFLSLSWTLRDGSMIRVNLLTERLSTKARRWLEIGVALCASGLGAFFCTFLWRNLAKNWKRGAVSESVAEVPLWIPDLIVFIGATLLILQLAAHALRPFIQTQQEG